ncbi:MAG: hypothetical protein ORN28_11150 [Rhodoferax sp.]|nr:hypothetical protein [Rhodoferax sp.]
MAARTSRSMTVLALTLGNHKGCPYGLTPHSPWRIAATIPTMPTLITHAKPIGARCLQASVGLRLPYLTMLLRHLRPGPRRHGSPDTLTPLAEQLHAECLGLASADGLTPWAALQAQSLHIPAHASCAWAWLTPCHWQVNADHVAMAPPDQTQISATESHTLMDAMRPLLLEDGITLHGLHAGNWLAAGEVFRQLPTAALARACGAAVDHWLVSGVAARPLRRLQNEMQMLVYAHPVNTAREKRKLLPINSFWVSGTGDVPTGFTPAASCIRHDLRQASQDDNPDAWLQAWQTLERAVFLPLLEQVQSSQPARLTLCGTHAAQGFGPERQGLWQRTRQRFAQPNLAALLQSL